MSAVLAACCLFFFQAEDGIRDWSVTGVQTCALPISVAIACAAADDVTAWHLLAAVVLLTRAAGLSFPFWKIGRASCRERVEVSVVAVLLKQKSNRGNERDA